MIWLLLLFLQLCIAHPFYPERCTPPTIRPLCQFPNITWIENIAVRSNGLLLVTLTFTPDLYQIDPFQPNPTPTLVATFPDALGILGIAEIEDDVFAITKGNFSRFTGIGPESFSVWKADFQNQDKPLISKIADLPEAVILNGMTVVSRGSTFVLIADSMAGVVWRLNLETAEYHSVLNVTATQPTIPVADGGFGVNGVHTMDGFLYFTNTDSGFYRVPIHDDGTPAGNVEVLTDFLAGDDFTFDRVGNAYVARGRVHIISKVTPARQAIDLDFENRDALVLIEGNTAMKFGRTERDQTTLYVTSNGGYTGLVNGTYLQGGRVLAIDLGNS
ncbi:hypothetical protein N431DRAFT_336818 [Stipitochalara longipes BDJ]|nr:hypothetical protein N431DRAFT_336818 [Stipitochalara longipes BDJ]